MHQDYLAIEDDPDASSVPAIGWHPDNATQHVISSRLEPSQAGDTGALIPFGFGESAASQIGGRSQMDERLEVVEVSLTRDGHTSSTADVVPLNPRLAAP